MSEERALTALEESGIGYEVVRHGREVSIGVGAHGVAVRLDGDALVDALEAEVADVTEPDERAT